MALTTNILLVDDLRDFRPRVVPSDASLTVARTSQRGVEILAKTDVHWDQLWLDHDLGEPDGVEDTSMAVVDYILFKDRIGEPLSISEIIVHSSNPVGVANILRALRSIGLRPMAVNAQDFFVVQ